MPRIAGKKRDEEPVPTSSRWREWWAFNKEDCFFFAIFFAIYAIISITVIVLIATTPKDTDPCAEYVRGYVHVTGVHGEDVAVDKLVCVRLKVKP
jgi:hypothetical protein